MATVKDCTSEERIADELEFEAPPDLPDEVIQDGVTFERHEYQYQTGYLICYTCCEEGDNDGWNLCQVSGRTRAECVEQVLRLLQTTGIPQ